MPHTELNVGYARHGGIFLILEISILQHFYLV